MTHRKERDWGALIREQQASGKSQAGFCRERGVSLSSFQYQKSKGVHRSEEERVFVPLHQGEADQRIEIQVSEELRVHLPGETSPERLSEVVRCLSSK